MAMPLVHRSVLVIALAAAAGLTDAALAQTWDGGGTNDGWTTANNWNPNLVPANDGTANIVFRGSTRPTPVVFPSQNVNAIGFLSPAGSFNITPGTRAGLTIGAGGITNADNSLQTISCPIQLSAAQSWHANTGPLSIGVVDGNDFALTVDGSSDTTITRIFGAGTSLTKSGSGTLTLTSSSSYAGGTSVNGGVLQVSSLSGTGPVALSGSGTVRSAGVIFGPVQNDGTVQPGIPVGTLSLQDAYTQGAGGSLVIEIGGATPTECDRLAVSGAANLSGTLTVTLVNGYIPARGDTFEVLTAGSIAGQFTTLNLPSLSSTNVWQVQYTATSLRLAVASSAVLTYQARLKNGAQLASGLFDFQFLLFDAPSGGNQLSITQCVDNVPASEGLFAASVDFGDQYSTPEPRFLEVRARADTGLDCSSATGFSVLGPRQRLLPHPSAAHANAAFALDSPDGSRPNAVFVDDSGRVGIGTAAPQASVHVVTAGEGVRIQGPAVGPGNATWIAFSDGNDADTGYVGDASASDTSIDLASGGDIVLYTASGAALTAKVGGNVGIGTSTPVAKLDVRGDIALGPAGQFRAAGSQTNLRILRGVINDAGGGGAVTIAAGSGFTMTNPSMGHYTITFNTPFSVTPSVTATAQGFGSDFFSECFVMTQSVTPNGFNVQMLLRDNGDFAPRPFHFIVVGLR
jgi:autotransporter-associated beta strand protein